MCVTSQPYQSPTAMGSQVSQLQSVMKSLSAPTADVGSGIIRENADNLTANPTTAATPSTTTTATPNLNPATGGLLYLLYQNLAQNRGM